QVAVEADLLAFEGCDHALARVVVGQRDDVDEPRPRVGLVVPARQLDSGKAAEELVVTPRHFRAQRKDLVELLELADADSCMQIVEPVVEAEANVLEPAAVVTATLVPQRA